jgi:DNA-binding IclR family transcriptional regulator
LLTDTCDVCDFTRVWYSSLNERFANHFRQIARETKFCTVKLSLYRLDGPTRVQEVEAGRICRHSTHESGKVSATHRVASLVMVSVRG